MLNAVKIKESIPQDFCNNLVKLGSMTQLMYSEPLKLRSTFSGPTSTYKNAGIEHSIMIIYLLTFYLLDDIEKYRNLSSEPFCYVKGNFDKNARAT